MLLAALLLSAASVNKIVEVDGSRFHVTVKEGSVLVQPRRVQWNMTVDLRDRMRRAVVAATGCQVTDDFLDGNYVKFLRGKLACVNSPSQ